MKERVMRILLTAIFMIIGAMLALVTISPSLHDMRLQQLIIFSLLLVFLALSYLPKFSRRTEPARKTITVIRCMQCDYRMERDFQEGDYVLKRMGTCSCGGELYIDMIYDVEIAKPLTR